MALIRKRAQIKDEFQRLQDIPDTDFDMDATELVESEEDFSRRWESAEEDEFAGNVISMNEMVALTRKLFSGDL